VRRASKGPTCILLVGGHPIIRFRIRQILEQEPDLSICAEADTDAAALDAFQAREADLAVVVMDPSPESAAGLEMIGRLHAVNPTLPIVVASAHDERLVAEQALRAGARAYLMKQHAGDALIPAIRQVLAGRRYVSPRVLQGILRRIAGKVDPP
jgi:DNA-binding NarL/FixJ family response regulator